MKCFFCKGTMKDDTTTYFSDLGSCIVIIKNVPCYICTQCSETVYSLEVGERLEQILESHKNSLTEVAIIQYSNKAA